MTGFRIRHAASAESAPGGPRRRGHINEGCSTMTMHRVRHLGAIVVGLMLLACSPLVAQQYGGDNSKTIVRDVEYGWHCSIEFVGFIPIPICYPTPDTKEERGSLSLTDSSYQIFGPNMGVRNRIYEGRDGTTVSPGGPGDARSTRFLLTPREPCKTQGFAFRYGKLIYGGLQ